MAGKRKTGSGVELRPESLESARSNLPAGASLAEITKAAERIQASNDAETAMTEKANGKKGGNKGQAKLPINDRGEQEIHADHELKRPMTHAEWEEQSAKLSRERVELMTLEDEIRRFRDERKGRMADLKESTAKGARECDAKAWLAVTPCIEVHDPSTRSVTVHAVGKAGKRGEIVIPSRVMTDEEYERACKSAPFEAPAMDPPCDSEDPDPII